MEKIVSDRCFPKAGLSRERLPKQKRLPNDVAWKFKAMKLKDETESRLPYVYPGKEVITHKPMLWGLNKSYCEISSLFPFFEGDNQKPGNSTSIHPCEQEPQTNNDFFYGFQIDMDEHGKIWSRCQQKDLYVTTFKIPKSVDDTIWKKFWIKKLKSMFNWGDHGDMEETRCRMYWERGNSLPFRVTKPASVRLLVPLPGMSLSSVEMAGKYDVYHNPIG